MDTIFALASARGKAGVSVVRVSGWSLAAALAPVVGQLPEPHLARLRNLYDGDALIDQALVIHFPAGASFTGEEVVEFHVHGSVAVVAALLRILVDLEGFRAAEPGEFTRRALMNGRLDLTQVEGIADLIEAETEAQRRQAMRVMAGHIGRKAEDWRKSLLRAAALAEATLDFGDEDLPISVMQEVRQLVSEVRGSLREEIEGFGASERIRDGFEVAIVGRPNVGKSTLLNRLAGREVALTSATAGTTRDVLEVRLDLGGLPVTFLDTAGLREGAEDAIERLGVERGLERARMADLRVFLLEPGDSLPFLTARSTDLILKAKADTHGEGPKGVSGLTGAGVALMIEAVRTELERRVAGAAMITRTRHRDAVAAADSALERALDLAGRRDDELVAEEIRTALSSLSLLIGKVDVEDLLGEIFSSFCIGK